MVSYHAGQKLDPKFWWNSSYFCVSKLKVKYSFLLARKIYFEDYVEGICERRFGRYDWKRYLKDYVEDIIERCIVFLISRITNSLVIIPILTCYISHSTCFLILPCAFLLTVIRRSQLHSIVASLFITPTTLSFLDHYNLWIKMTHLK